MHTITRLELIEAGYHFIGHAPTTGADIFVYRSDSRTSYNPQREHFRFMRVGGVTNDGNDQQANDWAMPNVYDDGGELWDSKDQTPQSYYITWGSCGFETKASGTAYAREFAETMTILADFIDRVNDQNAREWEENHSEWLARKQEWDAAKSKQDAADELRAFVTKHAIVPVPGERVAVEVPDHSGHRFQQYETGRDGLKKCGTSYSVKGARDFLKNGKAGGYLIRLNTASSRIKPAVATAAH